ncbi:hypothetical protein AWZ03_014379 [Drosophila navojoa]|uniref:Uncharacterized protein n=1 Tax=Drosophila navojoa TaxID=7232 RepID=A0A484ARJ4_DRONA|nr:hypothetical protein AWZ03_014379 [Drosophila navojoa]
MQLFVQTSSTASAPHPGSGPALAPPLRATTTTTNNASDSDDSNSIISAACGLIGGRGNLISPADSRLRTANSERMSAARSTLPAGLCHGRCCSSCSASN